MMLYKEMLFHYPYGLIHFSDCFDKAFQERVFNGANHGSIGSVLLELKL